MFELAFITTLATALMGGVFFVFSSFVMPALAGLKEAEGIRAMQRINVDVFCWSFSILFLATPLACVVLAIYAIMNLSGPESGYYLAGALVYLFGLVFVTGRKNVPLNHKLAWADPESPEGARLWQQYLLEWTRWNSLRALAGIISSGLFALGMLKLAGL